MSTSKVAREDFLKLVDIYNSQGKSAMYRYVRETYDIKQPFFVRKRIIDDGDYIYDADNDRFMISAEAAQQTNMTDAESVFMGIEELCEHSNDNRAAIHDSQRPDSVREAEIRNLFHTLVEDRLIELSKYVYLNPSQKSVSIDRSALEEDGYRVMIQ